MINIWLHILISWWQLSKFLNVNVRWDRWFMLIWGLKAWSTDFSGFWIIPCASRRDSYSPLAEHLWKEEANGTWVYSRVYRGPGCNAPCNLFSKEKCKITWNYCGQTPSFGSTAILVSFVQYGQTGILLPKLAGAWPGGLHTIWVHWPQIFMGGCSGSHLQLVSWPQVLLHMGASGPIAAVGEDSLPLNRILVLGFSYRSQYLAPYQWWRSGIPLLARLKQTTKNPHQSKLTNVSRYFWKSNTSHCDSNVSP